MHSTILTSTFLKRGAIALALVASVFALGFRAEAADAQVPAVSAGGPYQAYAGQAIELSGTTNVAAIAAEWSFSDGVRLSGLSIVRAFSTPGTYTATLTVIDAAGFSHSASTTVTVYAANVTAAVLNSHALLSGIYDITMLQSLLGPVVQLADGTLLAVYGHLFTSPVYSICTDPNYYLTPFCRNL